MLRDPVLIAVIALASTALGAIIAGAMQVLVARTAAASQAKALDRQHSNETDRIWRDERRRIYAGFLAATSAAGSLAIRVSTTPSERSKEDDSAYAVAIQHAFDSCYESFSGLSLVASDTVRALAKDLVEFCEESVIAAIDNETLPVRPPRISHDAVVKAMQKDLGLPTTSTAPAHTG